MCFDILKSPVAAIANAKKKSMAHAVKLLIASSLVFAVAFGVIMAKVLPVTSVMLIGSVLAAFILAALSITLLAMAVELSAVILGGKGGYYEGLVSVSMSSFVFSLGTLAAALLLLVPFGMAVAVVVLVPTLAVSVAILYKSIKELFRTDMITSYVTVSVALIAVIAAVYITIFLNLSTSLAGLV